MARIASFITDIYQQGAFRADCSGFFKAVAQHLDPKSSLGLSGVADVIIDTISATWVPIGKGAGVPTTAYVNQGYLVVALLKAKDHYPFRLNSITGKYDIPHPYHHGHLAIVLAGPSKDGYPYVICGSLIADGQSDGSKAVKGVWRGVDAANVQYYRSPTTFPDLTSGTPGK